MAGDFRDNPTAGGRTRGLSSALRTADALRRACHRATDGEPFDDRVVERLRADLAAGTYRPPTTAPGDGPPDFADLVVCWAVREQLEAAFAASPADPADAGAAVGRVADAVGRGSATAYVVDMSRAFAASDLRPHLARLAERADDPDLIELVAALAARPGPLRDILAPALAEVAYDGIDHVLEQAADLGRAGTTRHLECARRGHELVVLADADPTRDWLLPATRARLHAELSRLIYADELLVCQTADLARREPVRVFGYELRAAGPGRTRVHYRPLAGSARPPVEAPPRRPSRAPRPPRRGMSLPFRWPPVRERIARTARRAATWGQAAGDASRRFRAIQVRPEYLWLGPLAAAKFARRRWPDVTAAACGVAVLGCAAVLAGDVYANLSGESAALGLPPGFYRGQVQKGSAWGGGEVVPYGVYVPPHFRGRPGPFPLVVYLHAYGERTPARVFATGLPKLIADRLGEHKGAGRFEAVALFPVDPTGQWQPGSPVVEDALTTLDYVVHRHRIDPAQIALTGWSAGGTGTWAFAAAYPDRWAALAPVSAYAWPDVAKVRHIPAWAFHGSKDPQAPAESDREWVKRLEAAGAEVKYTEFPNDGHNIGGKAYSNPKLYEWLVAKRRPGG